MSEIIFEKAQKNLKLIYDRLQSSNAGRVTNSQDVLFLAIGGYNRTFDLLISMGVERDQIATFSSLNLSTDFLRETHLKKVVYIKKLNYVTGVMKTASFAKKQLDLKVAESFQESMMVYKDATRRIKLGKEDHDWIKPNVVILDDQSLNLQFDGYRFFYQQNFGFCQMRNRNAEPWKIIHEIKTCQASDFLKFVLYQDHHTDETAVMDALDRLKVFPARIVENYWYYKPTEFKKILGSNELVRAMKELPELGVTQLQSNKKIGNENARWVVVPEHAFDFKGFSYFDEEDIFKLELDAEEEQEKLEAYKQEQLLQSVITVEFPLNFKFGVVGNELIHSPVETLQTFLADVDAVEMDEVNGISLLDGATTEQEYKAIKKHRLAYFLDGEYKDNIRDDKNYLGGRRLLSIDIDEGEYSREEIEAKLQQQNLFGLVYPTAKYYFNQSKRWRIILVADIQLSKEDYRNTITGLAKMLNLDIDESSKKVSQLMGYPLKRSDVSIVIGTMVNIEQFRPKENVVTMKEWNAKKSLLDFNHKQAMMIKNALSNGVQKGQRNETYYQSVLFLKDTLGNAELSKWHEEAAELLIKIKERMLIDGLTQKEVDLICR
ncbi:hypothetical protein JXA27_10155 [Aerococcaceae bacterium zg-B36]|uniref:hypothetical protein n=1 Tax=Aerococcaceae bacterium zg-252 TaxID=2796928 RepID=UPI001BD90139|nr:hypothetical protein [Aerococcaceae bacterium zg-B36]